MRLLTAIILSLFFLSGCTMGNRSGCTHKVTVVDLTGLDGCGLLFQLENGQRLEPVDWGIEQPDLIVGKSYFINYENADMASICMAGKTIRITCITEA